MRPFAAEASDFPREGDLTHAPPKSFSSFNPVKFVLLGEENSPLSTPGREMWLESSSALPLLSTARGDTPGAPADTALPACQTGPRHTRPS